MVNIKVGLRPVAAGLNMPTVIKTAILPDDLSEGLFIATQTGEIFYIRNGVMKTFLDIRQRILRLGAGNGGYDERGLLGLAFHPEFHNNGLFYLHYSKAGSQGPGAPSEGVKPDPCNPSTLILKWTNRETLYNHIDTVEEWSLQPSGGPLRQRTLLNIRRPFLNHNGVNSLNFSPETGKLILTTGDGGSGYDPFNLSQNDMEIAGKIIEIDVSKNLSADNPPVVSRFYELPVPYQEMLTVIAKGVRNIPGIQFLRTDDGYTKYVGNVGQDLVEAIYSFTQYQPIPVTQLVQAYLAGTGADDEGFINFGWRGWEGNFPTALVRGCTSDSSQEEIINTYYDEAIAASVKRLQPVVCYFHQDARPDKFGATALTGVQPYMGKSIPALTGRIVFTDLQRDEDSPGPARGVLAYTGLAKKNCITNDYGILETGFDFGSQSAYYVSLGTNLDQTRLYLGVYGSINVTDYGLGTVYEVTP